MSLPGRILYEVWHRPTSYLRGLWLDGGPWQRARTLRGRTEMIAAASRLHPPATGIGEPLCVTLLTGARYWDMSVFCLISLAQATGRSIRPTILDDGSLPAAAVETIRRLFPNTVFEFADQIERRLDQHLPVDKFPVLRAHRLAFPLLRKITDTFAGEASWRLLIDSDLLFFRSPSELVTWVDHPDRPLHGRDLQNAYGYSLEVLSAIARRPIPEKVNTGTLGLHGGEIDWPLLERACATLLNDHGPHYYLEQALVAILVAGRECAVPPPDRYILCPQPPEALTCRAVMHHYVAASKRWYFQENWRRFAGHKR